MASWTNLVEAMHQAALGAFGVPATWSQQGGGAASPIVGIIRKPAQLEDVFPGSAGSSVVRFFVDLNGLSPSPQHGDTMTLNGNVYVIADIEVDIEGGAVLKLRIT
jgi:hypothetical protein